MHVPTIEETALSKKDLSCNRVNRYWIASCSSSSSSGVGKFVLVCPSAYYSSASIFLVSCQHQSLRGYPSKQHDYPNNMLAILNLKAGNALLPAMST